MSTTAILPGLAVQATSRWIAAAVDGVRLPLRFERIAGGRSNLTYLATDSAGARFVLRRPPLGSYPATAHDVLREARILAGLAESPVPVPRVLAVCEDDDVTGAPFILMAHVDGVACRTAASAATELAADARAAAAERLAQALAALHAVDPDRAGLRRPQDAASYADRQLRRWRASLKGEGVEIPATVERAHVLLSARTPPACAPAIVHGDFRLDNCLLTPRGDVAAVLDWELCAAGDPLADLGLLLVYWAQPGDVVTALEDPPTLADGFAGRNAVRSAYERASGRDLSALDFYVALAWWKLACIVAGVHARVLRGGLGTSERSAESFAAQARRLADQALSCAEALT
jgi:aminoglycoside phosphotransferase (APT) family kinase protein